MCQKKEFKPTPEQELAQSYDRDIVVTANAGSGKTSVLVDRYLSILLNYNIFDDKSYKTDSLNNIVLDPRQIVAITFTNQAAAEMKQKIVKKIAEKLDSPNIKRNEIEKLNKIRELVSNARISTIHSFCSSILREFPIEAGVSPNFSDLSDYDSIMFKNEAISNVLEEYLEDENSLKFHDIKKLLNCVDRKFIERQLGSLINSPELLIHLKNYYSLSRQELKSSLINEITSLYNTSLIKIKDICISVIESLDSSLLKTRDKSKFETALNYLPEIKFISEINSFNKNESEHLTESIYRYIGLIATKGLVFNALVVNTSSFKLDKINTEFKKHVKLFSEISLASQSIDLIEESIDLADIFYNLALDVLHEYSNLKEIEGSLDFNDLILKTHSLLQNTDIARKVSKKIKFLMVDEFQDTDDIQYDIIKRIVPELENNELASITNLFIVGDGKQSIYGFRNADVRVFEKAKEDIKHLNNHRITTNHLKNIINTPYGKRGNCSDTEILGNIELTASFRLLPNLAAFVNTVFTKILAEKESDFDINYSKLVVAKNTDNIIAGSLLEEDKGDIELLITEKPMSSNEDEDPDEFIKEPEMIAKYIISSINNSKNDRKYNFSDFAILSRAATDFQLLTFEFMKYGIPFKVHSGKGFYQTLEISDIVSFLSFLNDTNDDFALITILLSPFFNFNNTDLLNINCYKYESNEIKNNNFFDKLNHYAKTQKDETSEKSQRACDIIYDVLSVVANLSISQLIHVILEKTFWYATVKSKASSEQIEANMQKFIQSARNFENQGFKNLQDFIEEIKLMIEYQNSESEAAILNEDDVVNIMTVHASKGLEFPIVILFKSNPGKDKSFSIQPFNISKDYGITFKYNTKTKDRGRLQTVNSIGNLLNSRLNFLKESAEEKRVLYVALTRAKEKLVISALVSQTKSGFSKPKGFFNLILDGLDININELMSNINSKIVNNIDLPILHNNELRNITFGMVYNITGRIDDSNNIIHSYESPLLGALYLDKAEGVVVREKYSASKIIKFMYDKNEYLERYILGFLDDEPIKKDLSEIEYDSDVDDDSDFDDNVNNYNYSAQIVRGKQIGTLIHSTFEKINTWYDSSNKSCNTIILNNLIDTLTLEIDKKNANSIRLRIVEEVESVCSKDLIKDYSKYFIQSKYEFKLTLPIGDDFISAIIDLLTVNEQGYFEVWDWKSNTIHLENLPEVKSHYEFQMKLYAYFILKLNPKQDFVKCRLLFTYLSKFAKNDEDWTVVYIWDRKSLINMDNELLELIKEIKEYSY